MTRPYRAGVLAVIRCGLEQGMTESAFGGDERREVRRLAREGVIKITRIESFWIYATMETNTPPCSGRK